MEGGEGGTQRAAMPTAVAMPSKPVGGSDVRFVQRLFEKAVDTEVGAGHAHQLR